MARKQVALAKISRPRLHDVLARTALHDAIDAACARPVVWLCAQPGAGKTTLVASFLAARKRSGIWVQLDAADADAASFIYHLRLAALDAGDARGAAKLPLLTPEYLADLPGFARRFFRELYAGLAPDATLVLDNFQDVPDDVAAFHAVIAEAFAQTPPGINVIVLSRVEPPVAYAPLLAGNAIELVGGAQLRMTLAETRAIARKRGVVDTAAVEALHARSNGWAAGLTLLLMRTRTEEGAHGDDDDDAESLQHVFGYFAQRVFDGAAPEQRQALLQLGFLPLISVELAERLTGWPEVGRLLERYYKRHLFTDRRRVNATVVYQFHALFRTFLQHQARLTLGDAAVRAIVARAADALDAAGHWEQALALYADAHAWARYGRLIAARIEGLLEQGRRETALDWLARMPADARDADPWLAYWEGRALMATAPERALRLFDAGLVRFGRLGEPAGQIACGAAAVQTLYYARLGWSEITPWVDRIEALLDADAALRAFPSPATELLSYSALHAALTFCRPAHPVIAPMAARLLGHLGDDAIAWNQRLATAAHLITYFHNAAEHEHATALNALIDPHVETRPASALNRAYWYIFRAMHDLRQVDYEQAAQRFQRAEDLAQAEGLAHAEFAALQFRAYLEITFRHPFEAQARLARLERHPARGNPDGAMNYATAQVLYAQLRGDTAAALAHAERGLQAVERIGAAYFRAVFPALYTSALADGGQTERAARIVATSRELSRGSYLEAMESQLLLEEAYIALVENDTPRALERLAAGLGLAASAGRYAAYVHRIATRKPILLATALAHGIEVDCARELVRRWRVPPPPDRDVANWPWPIRVTTLGGFEVRRDDAPIEFGRKAPKKTLALLKAIIARGGSATEAALIDTFWRDEDGDAASRSLGAAVHRLRGLIGDAEAVQQQGGQISLDRGRVWVDAWAFERHADDAIEALALYRGTFLVEEEGEAWPVAMRERLRSRFIQSVSTHAARLEAARRDDEAIALYLRGIAADDVVEPFYQGLMRCYHRLDRLPEAVSAYRRLKQTLSVTLSLAPSAGTEKLYRTLRLG